jgi:four helix bundle protein
LLRTFAQRLPTGKHCGLFSRKFAIDIWRETWMLPRMPRDLDDRLFRFACRSVDGYALLVQRGGAAREIAPPVLNAAASIGANAAEASAGQTKADFLAKLGIARWECKEALFWLRLINVKPLLPGGAVERDLAEPRQIAAVLTAIVRKGRESGRRGDL